ncbi:MAG: VTT domain-containing protein [Cyanobacteria bacterium]|nr:VTT domain-containing protein [Cyanobacteriota bacterium]
MDTILHINYASLIQSLGILAYIVIFGIIFAESGLLIGFFLPGDSLLFTAGFLASQKITGTNQNYLNLWILIGVTFAGAVLGDSTGYSFGHKVGRRIFKRPDSRLFKRENLEKAEKFYEKYGVKTIILARFLPIIRTFAPIVAGVGKMHYKTFLAFNVIGGALWALSVPIAGYYLGRVIPNVDKYMIPIVIVIVIVSAIPAMVEFFRGRRKKPAMEINNKKNEN